MEEQYINFTTAKLAKEKGFDWWCRYYYETFENPVTIQELSYNNSHMQLSIPTQSFLQKWLREKKLHITVNIDIPHNSKTCKFYSNVIKFGKHHKSKFRSMFYSTYEEALEISLQEALKLIVNNN